MDQQEFQTAVIGHFQTLENRMDGMDARFDGIDERFDGVDARFDGVDTSMGLLQKQITILDENIDDIKVEIRDLRHEVRSDGNKLSEIYDSRNRVKVRFGFEWMIASFFIALVSTGVTQMFTIMLLTR